MLKSLLSLGLLLAHASLLLAQSPVPSMTPPANPNMNGIYTISWTGFTNSVGYELYEYVPMTGWTNHIHMGATNVQHSFQKLDGGKYLYAARAWFVNAQGQAAPGAFANPVEQIVDLPPRAPTFLATQNPSTNGQYIISWSAAPNTLIYELFEYSPSTGWTNFALSASASTSKTFTKTSNNTWDYYVRGWNQNSQGQWRPGPLSNPCARQIVQIPLSALRMELFFDDFNGPTLNTNAWNVGNGGIVVGVTMFNQQPTFGREGNTTFTTLHLDTYNPYSPHLFSGTEIGTKTKFACYKGLEMEARVRVRSEAPGIVNSFFMYAHDYGIANEIDFEFLTKQPLDRILTTTWSSWDYIWTHYNDGIHHSSAFATVPELNRSQWNVLKMRWLNDRTEWYVNNVMVRSTTEALAGAPMNVRFNTWVSGSDWADAYGGVLTPGTDVQNNTSYLYDVDYVKLTWLGSPSPAEYPTPATNLVASLSADSVQLQWENPSSTAQVEVMRALKPNDGSDPSFASLQMLSGISSYRDYRPGAGPWIYKIRIVNALGLTADSNSVEMAPPTPSKPSNLLATFNPEFNCFDLTWTHPENGGSMPNGYTCYCARKTTDGTDPIFFFGGSGGISSQDGIYHGAAYPYPLTGTWLIKIMAFNQYGNSESSVIEVTVP